MMWGERGGRENVEGREDSGGVGRDEMREKRREGRERVIKHFLLE